MSISPGDVINVDFGKPIGYEFALKHPAVVISVPSSQLPVVIVVPLTSTKRDVWTVVEIPKGAGNLDHTSYALCHHVRSISNKPERIISGIGRLDEVNYGKIRTVLKSML